LSETDSFIDEVTEELRRDRLFAAFRKYGWIAILGVVLLVGGAAFREWRINQAEARAEAFGDSILAAMALPDVADRNAALAKVTTEGSTEAAVLALIRAGSGEADALKAVQQSEGLDPLYQELASFKLLVLNPDNLDAAALTAGFEALAKPGAPYRLLAQEQIAYLKLSGGDSAAAIETFKQIAEDSEVTESLRSRAQEMLVALGVGKEG
jgi:hypothetical protein